MPQNENFQLKNWFDAARFRSIADALHSVAPKLDHEKFFHLASEGLAPLSVLQRMRHGTHALHSVLPKDFPVALRVLEKLAPHIEHNFVGMMLPDYVGVYGLDHFDESLRSLHWLTRFSSGEFAVREFLRRDLKRTLKTMRVWAEDENEHVRRLASEGSRPRLPWSFQLEALVRDPSPTLPILRALRADTSLYVRKSVGNHLNDISKDNAPLMLDELSRWDLTKPHTAWIAKRAARTLIKAGEPRALALFSFSKNISVEVEAFVVAPKKLTLGSHLTLELRLKSTAQKSQRLAIDYRVHYRKSNGDTSPKVFKWSEADLAPGAELALKKRQSFRDFTTRRHYAGVHRVELQINGQSLAEAAFHLSL